jgi:hypothetical protein
MYRENLKHLQPSLLSDVSQMDKSQRERLEQSWAFAFREFCFKQIDESVFAVLYSELPSRPNVPVNVLVGLEILKSGLGWSDDELYDAFLFDMQVRYAVGYESLNDGSFAIRSLYHFRQRLSKYHQDHDVNLLEVAFEGITDEQIKRLNVRTKTLRMDSTQIASDIRDSSRLHLLVEGVNRLYGLLEEEEQAAYAPLCEPYIQAESKHYVYRIKGREAVDEAIERIGPVLAQMLTELKEPYSTAPVYQTIQRLFDEHYRIQCDAEADSQTELVEAKANHEIGSGALQSLDDLEATYRQKAGESYQGYVANISETCDDDNDVQLIVKAQVAPNKVDDAAMLVEALPDLVERTDVDTMHTDGGYGSAEVDRLMNEHQIEQIQSAIRGRVPDPSKLTLADFDIEQDDQGRPTHLTCPQGQRVAVESGRTTGFLARFDPDICANCPLQLAGSCRAKPQKRNPRFTLGFTLEEVFQARRRQRHREFVRSPGNPRAAVEATVRSVKHPFRHGKLPVRGRFRVTCMVIASAAMCNVRRIQRYLAQMSLWRLIFAMFFAHRPSSASQVALFSTDNRRPHFFRSYGRRPRCRHPITCFSC